MARGAVDPEALETIPGIGPSMAADLRKLGIDKVSKLKRRNPEKLYERLCKAEGTKMDRCVLYVFRCAAYYATDPEIDQRLRKWWNWKDNKKKKV